MTAQSNVGGRGPRIGLIGHPSALVHETGGGHPERAQRIEAIDEHLRRTGLWDRLDRREPQRAARDLVEAVHSGGYLDMLDRLDADGGGRLDPDTRMGPGSLDAALRGSQAAVDAAARVLSGEWEAGFVLMRPPGHHATPDRGMGFCLTNHIAVAARWAVRSGGAERVAIVDWDAHHGNGTQDVFWSDPDVLYVSLHQFPWYPGTGDASETGAGAGAGSTLNVPLPAGAGEDAFDRALEEIVLPALRAFAPDLLCISAGYDAHDRDPLCMLQLNAGSFFRLTQTLRTFGKGPVCVLEGGYDLDGLAWSVGATLSALLGDTEPAGVPPEEVSATIGLPEAHRWVERAAAIRSHLTDEGSDGHTGGR